MKTESRPLSRLNFIVTIDVEEDNWGYAHAECTLENIRQIPRLQNIFEKYKVKPTYLLSYPVVCSDWAARILAHIVSQQRCEIGTHLHPWNTPPLTEDINESNSMLKNLPYELQVAKLTTLTEKIQNTFGTKPQSFRAGRWGLGATTIDALVSCGYRVDTSVTPTVSWSKYGSGPQYQEVRTEPYWITGNGNSQAHQSILEVPTTIGFNRWPFDFWHKIYVQLERNSLSFLRPIGLMHRTGLLRKIWLSPEINSTDDMILLAKLLIKKGTRFLNLSFHSTSLVPGKSPFVKNAAELELFYNKIDKLLAYLSANTNLVSLTLSEVRIQHGDLPAAAPVCPQFV